MIHCTDAPEIYTTGARCVPVWFPKHNCYHWVVTEFEEECFDEDGDTVEFPSASSPNINGMYNYHQRDGADAITDKDAENMTLYDYEEEKEEQQ